MYFGRVIIILVGRGESWKDIDVEPNLYVTMVWAVFWDPYHTKHRNRRRRWRKIYMGGITFFFHKLVVRITLKTHNNIMFFITPWSLTGTEIRLSKYTNASLIIHCWWLLPVLGPIVFKIPRNLRSFQAESDDGDRCPVLYSINYKLGDVQN